MVGLRAFDGLDADAILEIGWQRLAEEHEARVDDGPRDRSRRLDVQVVIDRIKADGPADFDGALDGLPGRDGTGRARISSSRTS